jgi:hypothetical protein
VATLLATPSSANLASAITDETGSGALVFATSPTLVTPILGTPTSGTLTNATGLPISTGVSGLGTGVATFLATPSSANLISAVTDETGTGSLVFATSPTLVTPALGTPTSGVATNLTGLPLTTGVTGLLPVANGGTATATPSIVAGTNITVTGTWPNQTIAASGGSGSVTSVSVVSANGFAGTVATATSTPAITVSTSITGVLKGDGTAISAATAGTDYVAPSGALGTPSSGTLTNATGLPLTTGVTGTLPAANGGTGVANNAAMTVTGSGNFAYTRTLTGTTNVTFPTTGTLATLAGTETFTNKTLTTPIISSISNTGTLTLPTSTDTLVGRATTDTLTNKTLTNPTVTNYVESVVVIGNSGTTQTLSLTSGTVQTVTMTGNCTFTMPTATAGKSFILICTQDGTGSRTATFTSVKFPAGTAPTLTTTATTGVDILTFVANGTSWFGTYAQAFA